MTANAWHFHTGMDIPINVHDVVLLSIGPAKQNTVQEDPAADLRVINTLTEAGFPLYLCTSTQELFALFGSGKNPTVILDVADSGDVDGYMLSSVLQSAFHARVILFVGASSDDRTRGLASGADFCLSHPVQQTELIAVLHVLHRRIGQNAASPAAPVRDGTRQGVIGRSNQIHVGASSGQGNVWMLESRRWRLRTPSGDLIDLSDLERAFMTHLFRAPEYLLRRDRWNELCSGAALADRNSRHIDVTVSRLRRKIERAGCPLPLYVRRGVGYQFAGLCVIEDDSAVQKPALEKASSAP